MISAYWSCKIPNMRTRGRPLSYRDENSNICLKWFKDFNAIFPALECANGLVDHFGLSSTEIFQIFRCHHWWTRRKFWSHITVFTKIFNPFQNCSAVGNNCTRRMDSLFRNNVFIINKRCWMLQGVIVTKHPSHTKQRKSLRHPHPILRLLQMWSFILCHSVNVVCDKILLLAE